MPQERLKIFSSDAPLDLEAGCGSREAMGVVCPCVRGLALETHYSHLTSSGRYRPNKLESVGSNSDYLLEVNDPSFWRRGR